MVKFTQFKRHSLVLRYKLSTNLFILSFIFSYFVNLDLLYNHFFTDKIPAIKYLPSLLSIFILLLILKKNLVFYAFKDIYFLLMFFLFLNMMLGSIISILFHHNSLMDSFLGRSLNMIIFFASYLYFKVSPLEYINNFYKKYIKLSKLFGFIYIVIIYIYFLQGRPEYLKNGESFARQVYHVEVFYIVPIFLFFKNRLFRTLFLLSGIASWKNTGFIISFVAVLYEVKNIYKKLKEKYLKIIYILFIFYISLLLFITIYLLYTFFAEFFPKGSLEVRLLTYYNRLDMFMKSPIFGKFFVGNPNMEIGNIYIPSHSDTLDLLGFGGILSIIPFLLPILKNFFYKNDNIISLYAFFIVINGFIAMTFNPLILQPSLAIYFYFWFGFILASKNSPKMRYS